jgi:hypothetical protein
MGRRHAIAIATALGLLATPAAAAAKEVSKVSVCGMDRECVVYDGSDFKSLTFLAHDAGPTDPPAAAAPWYRVRFTVDAREHGGGIESWGVAYVPSADSLRVREEGGDFAWVALSPRTAVVLERAARDLPAFPRARLRGLEVEPPQVRVNEVVRFAPRPDAKGGESATAPWGWIAGGALSAMLVLLTVARTLRRRGALVLPAR